MYMDIIGKTGKVSSVLIPSITTHNKHVFIDSCGYIQGVLHSLDTRHSFKSHILRVGSVFHPARTTRDPTTKRLNITTYKLVPKISHNHNSNANITLLLNC